jgi:hypothetical protein
LAVLLALFTWSDVPLTTFLLRVNGDERSGSCEPTDVAPPAEGPRSS